MQSLKEMEDKLSAATRTPSGAATSTTDAAPSADGGDTSGSSSATSAGQTAVPTPTPSAVSNEGTGDDAGGGRAGGVNAVPAAVEAELGHDLRRLFERVGCDCRERRAVARYQLGRLEELAAPAHVRFLMWLMMQVRMPSISGATCLLCRGAI